ncbi:probable RNA polymerase II nuclear localization protein SLC7A6OS [Nematostella vectensis]|uniref:probable RNA polymerase II nuclear localization protein SLC7A6OS n=1 Tax=Nematostella vectensis TaxID=45351 RepID=UPI002077597A|nr:probable RNA polymerase II nuclear localization protein SLC7A6OS [Nematostella vectensis]
MAAASVDSRSSDAGKRVILRVKRKRTDDPVEALVVSHILPSKKNKTEEKEAKDKSSAVDQVFTLLGTTADGDRSAAQKILKNIKSKPLSHANIKTQKALPEKLQTKLRKEKKKSHQDARFKLVSSNRSSQADALHSTDEPCSTAPLAVDEDSSEFQSDEVQNFLKVYDVIRDEDIASKDKLTPESKQEDTSALVCNSVKMVREKLAVSNDKNQEYSIADKGYVYDFYYADDIINKDFGDVLEITGVNDDFMLEKMDQEFDEVFDDDDDSNDENNWRNDYPDEGEWSSEDENRMTRLPDPDFGFDIDDRKYYRQAFGEDSSSDDELDFYGEPCKLDESETYNEELNDLDEGF